MYCVNCGVKLADTEKKCPLCGVGVFHPEIPRKEAEPLYPKEKQPALPRRTWLPQVLTTAIFLLPLLFVLLSDYQRNDAITWSGYVVGALLVGYVVLVLPLWFRNPNYVIFVPCGFGAVILYLLYIHLATGGGWFLSFAFPVTGGIGLIVTAVVTLAKYVRKGKLYIFGGAVAALGAFMLLVEYLMDITFGMPKFFGWSLYPMITMVLLGGLLIFLAIYRPAREAMERKVFL